MQPVHDQEPAPMPVHAGAVSGVTMLWRIFFYLIALPTLVVLAAKWLLHV